MDKRSRWPIVVICICVCACRAAPGSLVPADGLVLSSATASLGIEGQFRNGDRFIVFRARTIEGRVTAAIVGDDGALLAEYREFGAEALTMTGADGSVVVLSRPPELTVHGVATSAPAAQFEAAARELASSKEAPLIKDLGLQLAAAAPGADLARERAALELPLQAIWDYLPQEEHTNTFTMDYVVGSMGYVVRNQPEQLVLRKNFAAGTPDIHVPTLDEIVGPGNRHDDDQVNGCFGRCGSGCTGGFAGIQFWPSQWTDTHGATFEFKEEYHCETGQDVLYRWWATPTTHSVSGWWTPGCQLHDNCCRLNELLCWTACNVLAVGAILTDPLGEVRTWTYTDYSWNISSESYGFSGCTCPDASPFAIIYECVE